MVFRSGLWLLLVACAAAYQNYDDAHLQNFDDDVSYNDDGYADIDYALPALRDDFPKDLVMFKLINMSRKRSGDEMTLLKRPTLDAMERNLPLGFRKPSEDDLKTITKDRRLVQASANTKPDKKKVTRYQPRWRVKRPPRLCLLKLCAPLYYVYE